MCNPYLDIFLNNAADINSWNPWGVTNLLANVYPNGTIYCTPPILVTTSCRLTITQYPFDEKNCSIGFASWMHTKEFIRLKATHPKVVLDEYIENDAWILYDTSQTVNEQSGIDNLGGIYSVMTVDLYLRRRSLFFSFNFILPSLMITICGIFGFMLPPDCGEKINLQITNLLGVYIFSQSVANIVPASSLGIDKLTTYLFTVSFFSMISLIGNVYVIDLYKRDIQIEKEMPLWFENIVCKRLGPFLGMKKLNLDSNKNSVNPFFENRPINQEIVAENDQLKNYLKSILKDKKENKIQKELVLRWKYAAIVMDRFFLYLSLIYLVITVSVFILSNKNLYQ